MILKRPRSTEDIERAALLPEVAYQPAYRGGSRRDDHHHRGQYAYQRVFVAGWWDTYFGAVGIREPVELHSDWPYHHPWVVVEDEFTTQEGWLYWHQRKPLRNQDVWWAAELTDADQPSLVVPALEDHLPIHPLDIADSTRPSDPRVLRDLPLDSLNPSGEAIVRLPLGALATFSKRTQEESLAAWAWHAARWITCWTDPETHWIDALYVFQWAHINPIDSKQYWRTPLRVEDALADDVEQRLFHPMLREEAEE